MKRLLPLLVCLAVLAGCASAPRGERAELDRFAAGCGEARSANPAWTAEEQAAVERFLPDYDDGLLTDAEIAALVGDHPERKVGRAEARADVELYFRALRAAYGGYAYFGGDAAFGAAEEEVLAYLERYERFEPLDLEHALARALEPVVRDGHFYVGGTGLDEGHAAYMYYVPELYFDDTTGLDMDYVRPTVGPDGRITYCFAALAGGQSELPERALLGGAEMALAWRRAEALGLDTDDITGYRRTQVKGLPVLESRTMAASATATAQVELERFAAAGPDWRGEPVIVVDIRGNGGGNSAYSGAWLEGFADTAPQWKYAGGTKYSTLFLACLAGGADPIYRDGWIEAWAAQRENMRGQVERSRQDGVRGETDSLLLVLTDRGTGSAAEDFTVSLRAMDNVLLIGSNTHGDVMFGNRLRLHLPNTGLSVAFGASLSFWEDTDNREGAGFPPDLWVNPPQALDAAVRLCRYYGLA